MKQVLKNHVAVVIDKSASMNHLIDKTVQVFNEQIKFLRNISILEDQETRISVYTFNRDTECLISDVDVARPMEINKIQTNGSTSLLDACKLAIDDFKLLPQKYGDHSFLLYLLTDGEENTSDLSPANFKKMIENLPDNFSVCAFVPDNNGIRYLKALGIPEGNIDKWDTTQKGIEEVGKKFEKSMSTYYATRSAGGRKVVNMLKDIDNVTIQDIKRVAVKVKNFKVVQNTDRTQQIRPLLENHFGSTFNYVKGNAYYELVKRETIQRSKSIAVRDRITGDVFVGYDARQLLGLPDHEVQVDPPAKTDKWQIFVQSQSVNRNIIPFQHVIYLTSN